MIRAAAPEDFTPAAALLAAAGFRGWSADALARPDGDRAVWVTGPVAAPVGVALVQWVLDEAELVALAVAPAHRRTGLARALLAAAMTQLAALGVARLHLEVRAGNRSARALYTAEGFEIVGRRAGFYGDEDAVLMARSIVGSSAADPSD